MSAVVGVKRKGTQRLLEIKSKLAKFGLGSHGNKAELNSKLQLAENVQGVMLSKHVGDNWTTEDMLELTNFLPGYDPETWEPADVLFLQPIINTRSHVAEIPAAIAKKTSDIYEYYQRRLTPAGRAKTRTVTADALVPMMTVLGKKPHIKWGTKEVDLLMEHFGDVTTIDANASTAAAVDQYLRFFKDLTAFYIRRPDIKALVDPDVVIFDLSSNIDVALYTQELADYTAVPVSGGAQTRPAHLGAFPAAWNPGPVATVFPMPTYAAAAHFVGHMQARVQHLRAVLLPGYGGPNLLL